MNVSFLNGMSVCCYFHYCKYDFKMSRDAFNFSDRFLYPSQTHWICLLTLLNSLDHPNRFYFPSKRSVRFLGNLKADPTPWYNEIHFKSTQITKWLSNTSSSLHNDTHITEWPVFHHHTHTHTYTWHRWVTRVALIRVSPLSAVLGFSHYIRLLCLVFISSLPPLTASQPAST